MRKCPQCGIERPLIDFRRWLGRKKVLRRTCNVCDPPPVLREMSQAQRRVAVEAGRFGSAYVAQIRETERKARAARAREELRLARHKRRKHAWDDALFGPLEDEEEWVRVRLLALDPTSVRAPAVDNLSTAPWLEFFTAYRAVLRDARRRARIRLNSLARSAEGAPINPPPLVPNFVFPETVRSLRRLYARCLPLPGRRMRDPLCLGWSTEDEEVEE